MRRHVVGVMGGGEADPEQLALAYELGRLVAESGWVLLNGGRASGIMDASARGAHEAGGLTIGVLPDDHDGRASRHLDVAIRTGMGSARNAINVLSSDVVIACTGGAGTLSEIALALKAGRPVIVLGFDLGAVFSAYERSGDLVTVRTPAEAIAAARRRLWAAP
jgi:uncharacterized protein (TIGR00725 family)